LAEELLKKFDVEAKLVPGNKGIFDVVVDGKTVFSKSEVRRFPNPGEVINEIKA
jgi:selT/selW/selH-like putative selenoprotein